MGLSNTPDHHIAKTKIQNMETAIELIKTYAESNQYTVQHLLDELDRLITLIEKTKELLK